MVSDNISHSTLFCRSKDYLRRLNEGSGNVDPQGNFSLQVLSTALERMYGLSLPAIGQSDLPKDTDITSYPGFICNRASHWFAIRKIGTHFWNLNSTLEQPEAISHFRLAAELEGLERDGYAVFVITGGELPASDRSTGSQKFWWQRSKLEGKKASATAATDWNTAGTGRRLDGKKGGDSGMLTEEEQLQMALQASILPDVPEEPAANATGVVTMQFKFPNGKRIKRRFLEEQPVLVVYAYCEQQNGGGKIELKFGFPPRDLSEHRDKSIIEAKLKGESIQVRNA